MIDVREVFFLPVSLDNIGIFIHFQSTAADKSGSEEQVSYLPASTLSLRPFPALNFGTILSEVV